MGLPFATRDATDDEVLLFKLMLATFRDGSGNQKDNDNRTRADWRQIERCVAELLNGDGGEDKGIFDVILLDQQDVALAYGFSIKSKQLCPRDFLKLQTDGRVYMEIANSPAKFWNAIGNEHELTENDFRNMSSPNLIGGTVLNTVMEWHREGKRQFDVSPSNLQQGKSLDLGNSCYLCITSSNSCAERLYQVHSFPLEYPGNIQWRYKSAACLSGYDPDSPNDVLVDWYGVSGGQLKYYPSVSKARYSTNVFSIPTPPRVMTIREKANMYFPDLYPGNL